MQEYADFLGSQPPFDRLDGEDLARLARVVEVEFFAPGAEIVPHGVPLDHVYVIRKGAVQVRDRGAVVDELGVGDTFGHLSLLSGLAPASSVVAVAETLCYRLPDPRTLLRHPERFGFGTDDPMFARRRLVGSPVNPAMRPVSEVMRPALWCAAETPIREAARLMTQENQSCVLVRIGGLLGIVTDSDCRSQVATGDVPLDAPVASIASTPARDISATEAAADAYLAMVTHGVHHLVVTDGSGQPVGVARVFDLSSAEIRHPLTIRAAIDQASEVAELMAAGKLLAPTAVDLFDSGLEPRRVSALLSAITEAVLTKFVELEHRTDDASWPSWLVLGSVARREPLPCSDLDTALVWVPVEADLEAETEGALHHAERVVAGFEGAGLRKCPDGANADNPLFNRSLEAWTAAAWRWRTEPDVPGALLLSSMLTDSRAVTNLPLGRTLDEALRGGRLGKTFLDLMLRESLARKPPTGFVRDFVVEAGGDHRGELDLKRRGLGPIVALARWTALATRMPVGSTQDRLRNARRAGVLTADEADTLGGAYGELFDLVFSREVERIRAGATASRYVDPKELDTLTRRHLRQSFQAVGAVQRSVEAQWVSRLS